MIKINKIEINDIFYTRYSFKRIKNKKEQKRTLQKLFLNTRRQQEKKYRKGRVGKEIIIDKGK